MEPGVVVHPADWRLGSGNWIYELQKEGAGGCWDALVTQLYLSLQNLCLEEEAALLEIFYELHRDRSSHLQLQAGPSRVQGPCEECHLRERSASCGQLCA